MIDGDLMALPILEIEEVPGGTRVRHVEELDLGHGPLGFLHDAVARSWFARSVESDDASRYSLVGLTVTVP